MNFGQLVLTYAPTITLVLNCITLILGCANLARLMREKRRIRERE